MSALAYLLWRTLANGLKRALRRPSFWIVTVLVLAILGVSFFGGGEMRAENLAGEGLRDVRELVAMAFALNAVMFVMLAMQGLSRGASMFSMADVNLLFPAPVPPVRILLYGLLRGLSTALMLGLFLLFQYSWVNGQYGVGAGGLLLLVLCYGVSVFLGQITATALYAFSSGSAARKRAIRTIAACVCLLAAGYALYGAFARMDAPLAALVDCANSPAMRFFPVGGWLAAVMGGVFTGDLSLALWGALPVVLLPVLLIALLSRMKRSYYEDVLAATEYQQQVQLTRQSGSIETAPEKVRLGKTGLSRGEGASALYYKHKLEDRRARASLIGVPELIYLAITFAYTFFLREEGILPALIFATVMQVTSVMLGRWVKELTRPYIYLIPEPPFQKLLQCLRTSLRGMGVEAVLCMVGVGLILGLPIGEIAALVLVRFSFGLLFMAGNLMIERLFGGMTSKVLVMFFYYLSMIVLAVPGTVACVLAAIVWSQLAGFFLLAAVNVSLAVLVAFLCRNVLRYAELNQR